MIYYYKFCFKIHGYEDRTYSREFRSFELLTLDIVKNNEEKYNKIRISLLQEVGLNLEPFAVELFDIVRINDWRNY